MTSPDLAGILRRIVDPGDHWTGSASDLLDLLACLATPTELASLPKTPSLLSRDLAAAEDLDQHDIAVSFERIHHQKTVTVCRSA